MIAKMLGVARNVWTAVSDCFLICADCEARRARRVWSMCEQCHRDHYL